MKDIYVSNTISTSSSTLNQQLEQIGMKLTWNLGHPAHPILAEELAFRWQRLGIIQTPYTDVPKLILYLFLHYSLRQPRFLQQSLILPSPPCKEIPTSISPLAL